MLLCDLEVGKCGIVKRINGNNDFIIRLYNLGLVENTKIELVLKSYGIKAYSFRNSLIAIRDSDASNIIIGGSYD